MTIREVTAGIDLGGTGTRIALVSDDGLVAGQRTVATVGLGAPGLGSRQSARLPAMSWISPGRT